MRDHFLIALEGREISKARDQSCTSFQQSTGPGSTKPSPEPALIQKNYSSRIPGTPQQKTINGAGFCPVQSALDTVLNGLLHTNAGLDSICASFFSFMLPLHPFLFFTNICRATRDRCCGASLPYCTFSSINTSKHGSVTRQEGLQYY